VVEVAAGNTNREIARTLFVTEEPLKHRGVPELNVSFRRELPDVLARAGG
jgi:predicted transcriptional regulator